MTRTFAASVLVLVATFLAAIDAGAHESRPLHVEISEAAPNAFMVSWKIPPSTLGVTTPVIVMPESCEASAPPAGGELIKRQLFTCSADISGQSVRVDFPRFNPSISTLFQLSRLSGEKHTAIKGPKDPSWQIPEREAAATVALQYLALGVEHILTGYDHLLFVGCLVLIAGSPRRILITVTGFTLAHSVTLALAALGFARVPVPPVEAAIALSIVFLATEIASDRRDTLSWRYPVTVAASFGLLHGFGFASVLQEIGLPQTEIPVALLFFNLGVEIGQIAVVLVLLAGLWIARKLLGQARLDAGTMIPSSIMRPAAYAIGGLASFWLIERIAGFV